MAPIRRALLSVGFLVALPLAFFGRALLTARTLDYDDLRFWFFPWKALLYREAHQGGLTFWLPWDFCGMPHVADIQRQIFYLPNAVFFIMPTWAAMVVFVAFHFAAAGVLMYWFLRSLDGGERISRPAAVGGALVFAFSAFPVLHLTQLPMLGSYVWIPGLLACVELYWRRSGERLTNQSRRVDGKGQGRLSNQRAENPLGLIGGSVFLALMGVGGAPQMAYIGAALAFAWCIVLAVRALRTAAPSQVTVALLATLAVPVLAALLCAVQLLPMAELSARSSRELHVPETYSSIDTDPPYMLATFLAPYAWGNPMQGTWIGQAYGFHEQCYYVGLVSLLLVGAALGDFRRAPTRTIFFLVVGLGGVLIALGNYVGVGPVGLHDMLRAVLPMFGKFRVPARWMVWTSVGTAVLAAFGIDALARYRSPRERREWRTLGPQAGALLAAVCCGAAILVMARHHPTMGREAPRAFILLGLALVACVLARWGVFQATLAALLLVGLVACDLGGFAARYVRLAPASQAVADIPILRLLRREVKGRYRIATHTDVNIPTAVATWCPYYGVHNVQGTNPLYLERYLEYLYYSQAGRVPPISDLAGLMHHDGFFTMAPVVNAMTDMLDLKYAIVPVAASDRLAVEKLPGHPIGEGICVHDFQVEPDRRRRLAEMYRPGWDPHRLVYFGAPPAFRPAGPPGPVRGRVALRYDRGDSLAVEASADRDCFLVLSEIDYPGWHAWVDGRKTPILRADDLFRAVPLPAGRHTVVMRFQPATFRLGLAISALTLLFLGGMTVLFRRRRS